MTLPLVMIDGEEFLTADETCSFLEVKPSTLYAYVSRGLLRSYRHGLKRRRLYRRVTSAGYANLVRSTRDTGRGKRRCPPLRAGFLIREPIRSRSRGGLLTPPPPNFDPSERTQLASQARAANDACPPNSSQPPVDQLTCHLTSPRPSRSPSGASKVRASAGLPACG